MAARSPWLEKYRPGSFRGVPFKVDSHSMKGGRRVAKHEFAQKDEGKTEDLGLVLKDFSLELYVLGDDYFAQRDALIDALDAEGPGELVHPYLGRITVQAGEYTLTETSQEGRIAKFSVAFTRAGESKFPEAAADDVGNAISNASVMRQKSADAFSTALSVANQPAFVVQAGVDAVKKGLTFLEKSVAKVTAPVANLSYAISNAKALVATLIRTPAKLAAQIQSVFDTLKSEFENDPKTREKILSNFKNIGDDYEDVITGTPSKDQMAANQHATLDFYRQESLANQADAAVEIDFDSVQAALLSRDDVITRLDDELDNADDDDLFQAIKDLQTSLARALPRAGTTEILKVTPPATIPALVLSYSLFETLERENEIIDQNGIENPCFVPGGTEIEVSANG